MTTASQALEQVDRSPKAMAQTYADQFTSVLPSHIANPDGWLTLAVASLKQGGKKNGQYPLEVAAANNIPEFLRALQHAASLGLQPGTEQYYLTPRKVKGTLQIQGIVGYQGLIELMFRGGAVEGVEAQAVYTGDHFQYRLGVDPVPIHDIDWDADDRGELRLVYAYARMRGGGTSRVVVLNRAAIERIKSSSDGASSQYSPWQKNPEAMWLKSAVRQLAKWVPTSAECLRRPDQTAGIEVDRPVIDAPELDDPEPLDLDGDDITDAEVVDGVA